MSAAQAGSAQRLSGATGPWQARLGWLAQASAEEGSPEVRATAGLATCPGWQVSSLVVGRWD